MPSDCQDDTLITNSDTSSQANSEIKLNISFKTTVVFFSVVNNGRKKYVFYSILCGFFSVTTVLFLFVHFRLL